jgi:hypothetical protein
VHVKGQHVEIVERSQVILTTLVGPEYLERRGFRRVRYLFQDPEGGGWNVPPSKILIACSSTSEGRVIFHASVGKLSMRTISLDQPPAPSEGMVSHKEG